MSNALLELRKVSHFFGSIQVLHDIDFDLSPGEVHALIGEASGGGVRQSRLMSLVMAFVNVAVGYTVVALARVAPQGTASMPLEDRRCLQG